MCLKASKDCDIKKKLLVLLIAVIPSLMPNLVFAVAIDVGFIDKLPCYNDAGLTVPCHDPTCAELGTCPVVLTAS